VALGILVLASGLATAQPWPSAAPSDAFQHVLILSQQIGPRPAGTPAYTRAVVYIAEQLARLGYTVERETFPFRFFDETHPPTLTVVGPARADLHPLTLAYSAPTPHEGIEGVLEPTGVAREEDLRGKHLEGRVALVARGQILFREKVANAASAGASAVIIYNDRPGPAQQGTLLQDSTIPAVFIPLDEGQRLLESVRAGPVRVKLVVSTVVGQRTAQNVIVIKHGTRTAN
jgi:aminopeptidase YwaD